MGEPDRTERVPSSTIALVGSAVLIVAVALAVVMASTSDRNDGESEQVDTTPVPIAEAPSRNGADVRQTAASLFTSRVQSSRLRGWNVRAIAAGADCGILLVRTDVNMEPSMIAAFHDGSDFYGTIFPGGVRQFAGERTFRGIAYIDARDQFWSFGEATPSDASQPCG